MIRLRVPGARRRYAHPGHASHPAPAALTPAPRRILAALLAVTLGALLAEPAPAAAQRDRPVEWRLAMNAKILCSGVFVQDRDPALHAREDLRAFPHFGWQEDFRYQVDRTRRAVTLSAPDARARTAEYNGTQGCTILPWEADDVFFEPVAVESRAPDPETTPWPTGDVLSDEPLPAHVDRTRLDAALDFAMDDTGRERPQNTRALVVVHDGRIVAERYASGWGPRTPQLSWSMGKSLTATLVGVLVQQGHFEVDDRAPVPEWSAPGDPRGEIRIADLLNMSSGLDFRNLGIGSERSLTRLNDHFYIYFEAPHVFRHAVTRTLEHEPGTVWRYRNSDPLTLGKIVRETVEARGERYHDFAWRHLFDRIGMRDVVLETDAWGNYMMTGYDYASARDWARLGLLHLWDGVWEDGERILPEGWADFVSTPAPAAEDGGYGGLWWLNRDGSYPSVPEDAYWAAGFMGQTTMVIPSRDVVLVRLGPSAGGSTGYLDEVAGRILAALEGG